MERVSVNDMRDKEVINICDGKRLGYIYDVEINVVTGCVVSIVVLFDCRIFGFGKCEMIFTSTLLRILHSSKANQFTM